MILVYALSPLLLAANVYGERDTYSENVKDGVTKPEAGCPRYLKEISRLGKVMINLRDTLSYRKSILVEIQIKTYLNRVLKECQLEPAANQTGTAIALPSQCTSSETKNLTEPWRIFSRWLPQKHSDHRKLDKGRVWFRFTGAAGKRLRNTCPVEWSCGGGSAYWSDDKMPEGIGEKIPFKVYESWFGGYNKAKCYARTYRASVTRCSLFGDFVYKLDDEMSGGDGDVLCGIH